MTAYHDHDYGTATAPADDEEDAATSTATGDDLGGSLADDEDDADFDDDAEDGDAEEDDAEEGDVIVVAEVIDAGDQPGTESLYLADAADDSEAAPSGFAAEPVAGTDPVASTDAVASTDPDMTAGQDLAAGATPELAGQYDSSNLSQQWHDIQARFVDDPADAVRLAAQAAEAAVTELISVLQGRQSALASGTDGASRPDTEQLRSILRECRTLCQDVAEMGRRLTQTAVS
jgi:hypothetical protein